MTSDDVPPTQTHFFSCLLFPALFMSFTYRLFYSVFTLSLPALLRDRSEECDNKGHTESFILHPDAFI